MFANHVPVVLTRKLVSPSLLPSELIATNRSTWRRSERKKEVSFSTLFEVPSPKLRRQWQTCEAKFASARNKSLVMYVFDILHWQTFHFLIILLLFYNSDSFVWGWLLLITLSDAVPKEIKLSLPLSSAKCGPIKFAATWISVAKFSNVRNYTKACHMCELWHWRKFSSFSLSLTSLFPSLEVNYD